VFRCPPRTETESARPSRRDLLRAALTTGAALAATPLITACGSGTPASPSTVAGTGPGPGGYRLDLGGYQGPEVGGRHVTLRFMRQMYTPEANRTLTDAYARFSAAYPRIKVREEVVPYSGLHQKLRTYVASGSAPDLMMGRSDFTSAYRYGDIAMPLQDCFAGEWLDGISPTLRDAVTVDGAVLSMPWNHTVNLAIVNRDLFDLAGVAPPPETTDPARGWTTERWLTALRDLRAGFDGRGRSELWPLAASVYGAGGPGSNYGQCESMWVRSMGSPTAPVTSSAYRTFAGVSPDGLHTEGYIDTPEAVQGMTVYRSLFKDRLTPTGAVANQLVGGTAAVSFVGVDQALAWSAGKGPDFAWSVSPAPRARTMVSCNVSDSVVLWSGSRAAPEAAALLGYLTNDANRVAFHSAYGNLPPRNALVDQMRRVRDTPAVNLAVNITKVDVPVPRTPGWFEYFNTMNPLVGDIALGADPAAGLRRAARRIDTLLAQYR
jgi:multiple sugar transport system substrate-binding protein